MYVKRIQLANYGPIQELDISFPFGEERPKPVLLVGENGSGKSILLSHIINAMINAKDAVYQESSEIDAGKVFKLRSSTYISTGAEYYFARVDFEAGLFTREMRLRRPKSDYAEPPMGPNGTGIEAWGASFGQDEIDHFDTNIRPYPDEKWTEMSGIVSGNCLLYFPSNRMEEPARLNEANLLVKPQYSKATLIKGVTRRQVIAHSPLRDVHNWLYDVAYDRAAFEINSPAMNIPLDRESGQTTNQTIPLPLFLGYRGDATNAYNTALAILQAVLLNLPKKRNIRFGISGRYNRILSIESDEGTIVPNVFQLSSGEVSLLALFLSILRDFDLREDRNIPFSSAKDIRGLVVVDEVDLHLHSRHQHDVLPRLIEMFPQVQFVMTTHSPLFLLGMEKVFGEDGFEVYELPTGSRIATEEFGEFDEAFQAFKTTKEFSDQIRSQLEQSQQPILYVEGSTDCDYLRRAAELLGKTDVLNKFNLQEAGGMEQLKKIWQHLTKVPQAATRPVILLYDPECSIKQDNKDSVFRRSMPFFDKHPIPKGIENLFDRKTLESVRQFYKAFIDIVPELTRLERGEEIQEPESWSVNQNEKRNLCNWLCQNGTHNDFRHFEPVFGVLEEVMNT